MSNSPESPSPLASTKRDIRSLGTNSRATAAELKAFLAEFKGRSPQEMLGLVAASRLARALMLSTIIVFALIFIFTAIPYFMDQNTESSPQVQQDVNSQPDVEQPKTTPEPIEQPQEETDAPDVAPLGLDEEKQAPPDVNPLENDTSDFLEGLE